MYRHVVFIVYIAISNMLFIQSSNVFITLSVDKLTVLK